MDEAFSDVYALRLAADTTAEGPDSRTDFYVEAPPGPEAQLGARWSLRVDFFSLGVSLADRERGGPTDPAEPGNPGWGDDLLAIRCGECRDARGVVRDLCLLDVQALWKKVRKGEREAYCQSVFVPPVTLLRSGSGFVGLSSPTFPLRIEVRTLSGGVSPLLLPEKVGRPVTHRLGATLVRHRGDARPIEF